MDTVSFLKTVVTTSEGWFDLLVGPPDGSGWHDEWFEWPNDIDSIVARAEEAMMLNNVYFTSHLYEHKRSTKDNVLSSRTIQCDLDDAHLPTLNMPSITVETSPGRHQGYWILQEVQNSEVLEGMSKLLTYSIPDADKSGWCLGHKMRLPGTLNHKYASGPKLVKVVSAPQTVYRELKLPNLKQLQAQAAAEAGGEDNLWTPSLEGLEGPRELWAKVRRSVPRRIQTYMDKVQTDGEGRSGALFALMSALFRAGLDRNQVFLLAQASANNKFKDNKYHADLDLAKDVIRTEAKLKRQGGAEDSRSRIQEARKLPGMVNERRAYISALVRDALQQGGSFITTSDGQDWYIREDTGRPVSLSKHSDNLEALLEMRFGLNSTEPEQKYVVSSLITTTKERGQQGVTAALSHYDATQNTLLLHTGRKDVYYIDGNSVSTLSNGNLGVVFPWRLSEDPFDADLHNPISIDTLFAGCFDNLDELSPAQALALVRAWLMFLLFRDDAVGKPILALFGQPGSGKSTLFRRVYAFLYGPSKALNTITSADDFDHAVTHNPLVVFDGVDTFSSWLPDKISLSAANSDVDRRKLYTDSDSVLLRRQALVAITAHNPKFRREDIVDRLIMLNFHRLPTHLSETPILERVIINRDRLWGQLILDAQTVLKTPKPIESEIPRFRVADYARLGLWSARALGFEEDFREALKINANEQLHFNLEEEDILVSLLKKWTARRQKSLTPTTKEWYTAGDLWTSLNNLAESEGDRNFERFYRNAVALGKKLFTLQETLKSVFEVEYVNDEKQGVRMWRITPR